MAEIKWIKITTNIFDDEKMKIIDTMPARDEILVIWFKLLCLAGKVNENGMLFMNSKIAYTPEMLAAIFNRPLNSVTLALTTFEGFGMIDIEDNDVISISSWEKHQNIEGMDKIREQNRLRQEKHRLKKKGLIESNVISRDSNAIEEDKNKIKNKITDSNVSKKPAKHKHGEYKNVLLTDTQYSKLLDDWGQEKLDFMITKLDEGIQLKAYKYKDHNLAIRKWEKDTKFVSSSEQKKQAEIMENIF